MMMLATTASTNPTATTAAVAKTLPANGGGGATSSTATGYLRRGNFQGVVFDVDHLATFTVGSRLGTTIIIIIFNMIRSKNNDFRETFYEIKVYNTFLILKNYELLIFKLLT